MRSLIGCDDSQCKRINCELKNSGPVAYTLLLGCKLVVEVVSGRHVFSGPFDDTRPVVTSRASVWGHVKVAIIEQYIIINPDSGVRKLDSPTVCALRDAITHKCACVCMNKRMTWSTSSMCRQHAVCVVGQLLAVCNKVVGSCHGFLGGWDI